MLNKKFCLRWLGITLVFTSYYSALFFYDFAFSLYLSTKRNEPSDNTISASTCDAIIMNLDMYHYNVQAVSYFGFMICVPLILFIYKKVR